MEELEIYAKISYYKTKLIESDFKAIKYAEGYYTEEEYQEIKALRKSYRDKINELEALLMEV